MGTFGVNLLVCFFNTIFGALFIIKNFYKSQPKNDPLCVFLELCLFYSEKQHVSCLYLVITHDIANIKSGNIFIAQLIAHYGCVSQTFSHSIACTSSFSIKKYKHIPLTDIKPKWFNSFSIIRRKFISVIG